MKKFFIKTVYIFIIVVCFIFIWANSTHALTVPNFPSCEDKPGSVRVHYSQGIHGIPGDPTTYQGEDTVYDINDKQIVQCLCTEDGIGIQTNWWKASSLASREEKILLHYGWIKIPTGKLWGLEDVVYYAKNSKYNCSVKSTDQSLGAVLGVSYFADTGSIRVMIASMIFITSLLIFTRFLYKSF